MSKHFRWILAIAVGSLTSACGSSTPYTMSGPSSSSQGVRLDLVKASCYLNRSADPFLVGVAPDRLGIDIRLQAKNESDQTANISEARMLLVESTDRATRAMTPEKPKVVSIAAGETKQLRLRYTTNEDLSCHHSFELIQSEGVDLVVTPMARLPIRFAEF